MGSKHFLKGVLGVVNTSWKFFIQHQHQELGEKDKTTKTWKVQSCIAEGYCDNCGGDVRLIIFVGSGL